ncbi:polyphosphate--glucose phosphotransferase [Ornithinimicrobium sp. Y1847]|uniref:polyphosphate--glucose phosphotransferase n=1 Tax=unclassified Ornithinimicrobium TaxID=2615080 RepID=UPI003B683830
MANKHVLGIDIGGSGIKGAPVNLKKGELSADRVRIDTPEGATPSDVAGVVAEVADHFAGDLDKKSPIGITVPAVAQRGVVRSAANIDASWIDTDADALFTERLGRSVHVVNDADAAGVAEVHYGAGRDEKGVVLLTTLGTGIGSALFIDGILVPNTELGHLEIDGHDAETRAANSAREREELSWEDWAERLQRYYSVVEALFSPDLIIVGGGVSKKAKKFLPLLSTRAPIVPAELKNEAGIIGAAWHAEHLG